MTEDPQDERPRRRRARDDDTAPSRRRPESRRREADAGDGQDEARRNGDLGAGAAARAAAAEVAGLTGKEPESVVSIERTDGGWQIGVEVVETRRIPDSADILATYEVRLEAGGELVSYRRTQRYARGQMNRECR